MDKRLKKAKKGVKEGRVKKYRDLWVVVGEEGEYIVQGKFCTCPDYFFNVSSKNSTTKRCWHSLAVEEAKKTGKFDEIEAYYHHFIKL